jgi:hypothetical protein
VVRANIRRWPAVRWAATAAVATALAATVAGCGQTQLGAVALYSNQRISSAKLAAEVSNLNAGYVHYKSKVSIPYKPAAMPGKVLTWMLQFATTERAAAREGITVTQAQAQAQLRTEKQRARQAGDSLIEVAVLNGLPPDMLPELGRWFAIQGQLASKVDNGVAPTTTAEQQALLLKLHHVQCLAAKSMNIKVNPQFGAYNYRKLAVVPATSGLSASQLAGQAHASPAPQPTAKC